MTDPKAQFLGPKLKGKANGYGQFQDSVQKIAKRHIDLRKQHLKLNDGFTTLSQAESQAVMPMMTGVVERLAALEDTREVMRKRFEARVAEPIQARIAAVKRMQKLLDGREDVMKKMLEKERKVQSVTVRAPGDRVKINTAKVELNSATESANDANKRLNESMEQFEKNDVADLKTLLREYLHAEMTFSAAALETHTACLALVDAVEDDVGLPELREHLYPGASPHDDEDDDEDDDEGGGGGGGGGGAAAGDG